MQHQVRETKPHDHEEEGQLQYRDDGRHVRTLRKPPFTSSQQLRVASPFPALMLQEAPPQRAKRFDVKRANGRSVNHVQRWNELKRRALARQQHTGIGYGTAVIPAGSAPDRVSDDSAVGPRQETCDHDGTH